jgi:hypothetical protein
MVDVEAIKVPRNKAYLPKGYVFVKIKRPELARWCKKFLDGRYLKNRPVEVGTTEAIKGIPQIE